MTEGPTVPVAIVRWEQVLDDLLDRTQRFPKSVRFTFSTRIDNHGLDILEELVEARFASGVALADALSTVDRRLTRLRLLLRLAHKRRLLDTGGFEHVMRGVDEVGRMVGGWRRSAAERTA